MSESLRDQLLKSGLASKLKAGQAGKPAKQKPAPAKHRSAEIDLAKAYALRDNTERAERERVQREAEQRAREKKERKQKLVALLNGKSQNVQAAEIPRHFPHANKIRRIYVTEDQLRCLNGGELGVVQLAGRYVLVDCEVAKAAREIDAEALVLLCDPMQQGSEDDVPIDLIW